MEQMLKILNLIKDQLEEVQDVDITLDSGGAGFPFEDYVYKDDVLDVKNLLDQIIMLLTEPEKFETETVELSSKHDTLSEKLKQKRFFTGRLEKDMDLLQNTISRRKSLSALVNPEYFKENTK